MDSKFLVLDSTSMSDCVRLDQWCFDCKKVLAVIIIVRVIANERKQVIEMLAILSLILN